MPGRCHGSVTVVGDQVFLATADELADKQFVLCFERNTGKPVWQALVHDGGIERKGNKGVNDEARYVA
jgi:glucose dehydrogenase